MARFRVRGEAVEVSECDCPGCEEGNLHIGSDRVRVDAIIDCDPEDARTELGEELALEDVRGEHGWDDAQFMGKVFVERSRR